MDKPIFPLEIPPPESTLKSCTKESFTLTFFFNRILFQFFLFLLFYFTGSWSLLRLSKFYKISLSLKNTLTIFEKLHLYKIYWRVRSTIWMRRHYRKNQEIVLQFLKIVLKSLFRFLIKMYFRNSLQIMFSLRLKSLNTVRFNKHWNSVTILN